MESWYERTLTPEEGQAFMQAVIDDDETTIDQILDRIEDTERRRMVRLAARFLRLADHEGYYSYRVPAPVRPFEDHYLPEDGPLYGDGT